jgi:hypothetical protein
MNEPRKLLTSDLQGARYLEALAARDLEIVANLWEEASRDPELERTLTEIDGALFEEADGSHRRVPNKRRRLWVAAAGALAAACLLGALFLHGRGGKEPAQGVIPVIPEVVHQPPAPFDRLAATRLAQRDLDETELPSFTWPLSQTSPITPTSMPADRLD